MGMHKIGIGLLTVGVVLSGGAFGQKTVRLEDLPDAPPPPPPPVVSGETLEPEVTIIKKKESTIEEYRLNGRLYLVKVTPIKGPPYYLMDSDGDGQLESRMSELYSDFVVPKWVLFSW